MNPHPPALHTSFNNKAAVAKLIQDMKSQKPESALKIEAERRPLALDFVPGPCDVICARGKKAAQHAGNVRFRDIIKQYKPRYAAATNKVDKGKLVSEIVDAVRQFSPDGGFVKKFGDRYYEVGDSVAREKIGQCLRDQLHTQYRSSTKAKKNRRRELRALKKAAEGEEDETNRSHHFGIPLPLGASQPSMTLNEILAIAPLFSQTSASTMPCLLPPQSENTSRRNFF